MLIIALCGALCGADNAEGSVIAIDGKTLRRSFDKAAGKLGIHMVSCWGC